MGVSRDIRSTLKARPRARLHTVPIPSSSHTALHLLLTVPIRRNNSSNMALPQASTHHPANIPNINTLRASILHNKASTLRIR
ncbi:MAG: hypothetical protein Q9228_008137, partial [Teloschistes exilis]